MDALGVHPPNRSNGQDHDDGNGQRNDLSDGATRAARSGGRGSSIRASAPWPCLLLPTALLLSLIIVYPVCRLVWTSFQNLSLTSGAPATFAGLENYVLMLEDPVFWETTWNTVLITVITVPGALLVGMALALMANLPFKTKWPIRLSLLIPWALPLAFAGLIFAWFFHSEYGVVNDVLRRLGFEGVIWFNSANWAFAAICLTIIWKTSSFMALIILAGLQTIPRLALRGG